MTVASTLEAILAEHDRLGSPLRRYLRPGLAENDVRARLASLGLEAPPELVEWFGLADGLDDARWQADADGAPDLALVTTVGPYSLADAITTYSLGQRLNAETGVPYWRADQLPVLVGLKCDYSITCARGDTSVWRVVLPPESGSWVTAPVAVSLETLLERMLVALRADAYVWDAELGALEPDDEVLDGLGPHQEATPFTILPSLGGPGASG
jgi:hypothetical protein